MPSYVGQVTANATTGVGSPKTISGLATGDVLLVDVFTEGTGSAHDVPGYTRIGTADLVTTNLRSSVWAKAVTGAPSSEPDVTITWPAGTRAATFRAWRGVNPEQILNSAVSTATGTNSVTNAAVTTSDANATAVHIALGRGTTSVGLGLPSGFSLAGTQTSATNLRDSHSRKDIAAAGTTGTAAVTASGDPTDVHGYLFALSPPPNWPADTSEPVTLGATIDGSYLVDGQQTGATSENVAAGATQDATYTPPIEADTSEAVTLGASQDAGIGAITDATEGTTLGASQDATFLGLGEVTYPSSDTWQTTIAVGPTVQKVTITDDQGSAPVILWVSEAGTEPIAEETVTLGTTADAQAADFGASSAPVTLGDAVGADYIAPQFGDAAAAVTLGTTTAAEALPPLPVDWATRTPWAGLSALAGPFAPDLFDLEGRRTESVTFGTATDAVGMDYGATDAAVSLGVEAVGAFGPAYDIAESVGVTVGTETDAAFEPFVEKLAPITVKCPRYAVTVACPRYALTSRWPRHALTVERKPYALTISCERYALTLTVGRK